MDRGSIGKSLEALAEEDDEEEMEEYSDGEEKSERGLESDSNDSDDDPDEGVLSGEPNKFDGLCDGVLGAVALVHCALQELLDLKDELLMHALPPTLLVKLAMTSGKVFRSISDMTMPVSELVRLVRVYSTPWEEKSAALKKLHEDYESKQRQLNIAIKRLQLVDAHSKRIAREKRIMNWEKLFSKMTSTKGHGRRWKFLIETIKQKAKMGLEHVQEYTKALEEMSESEEDEPEETPKDSGRMTDPAEEIEEASPNRDDEKDIEEEEEEEEEEAESDNEEEKQGGKDAQTVTIHITGDSDDASSDIFSRSASPKRVRFESEQVPVIKPPVRDSTVSTEEPEYDLFLHLRVFAPEDLEQHELKCSVTYGEQMFKTGVLDIDDSEPEKPAEEKPTPRPQAASLAGRGRVSTTSRPSPVEEEPQIKKKFEELTLRLPDEIPTGVLVTEKLKTEVPQKLQIAVHHGQFEEIIAMATIDLDDVRELNLRTIYLPPPKGDDDVPKPSRNLLRDDLDSLSDSVDLSFGDEESEKDANWKPKEDPVKDVDPLPFPLYSLHAGRSDAVHMPCGNLPLLLYWAKRRRPQTFNRQIGTHGVNELVFELTGIDLNTTSKEDLNKDTSEIALSAIDFTPEPREETVLKADLDEVAAKHSEEMEYLHEEYRKQIQELEANIQQLEAEKTRLLQQQQNMRPVSGASRNSSSPHTRTPRGVRPSPVSQSLSPEKSMSESLPDKVSIAVPFTPGSKLREVKPSPPISQKPRKNFRVGRPLPKWGESLPQDFFERLRLYEEESKQHMAELNEKTLRDIKESLEKKLAGQHKLSKREEEMYDALKDVSLPALFMPFRTGTVFNPRAHQYFHPTGSTDLRLTQPPSMFQLPPLPKNNKMSVVNLFELSSNFRSREPGWLMERYIQQQRPVSNPDLQPSVTTSLYPEHLTRQTTNFITQDSQITNFEGPQSLPGNNLQEQEIET